MGPTVSVPIDMLSNEEEQQLIAIARESILQGLDSGQAIKPHEKNYSPALHEKRAVFVTLKINAELRGCVGTTETQLSLIDNVAEYANRAAFHDPRFCPLEKKEFNQIIISISILSPKEPIEFSSEADLLNQLCTGIDGLVIEKGSYHATFLPTVWESLPDAQDFLRQLKLKAKIPASEIPTKAWRYHAVTILET
jgi:AmmeMemoRadiSam system protein A